MEARVVKQFSLPSAVPVAVRAVKVDQWHQWCALVVLALLAYLPYAEFVHDQFGITFFGYGAEVTIIPTAIIMLLFSITAVFRYPSFFLYPALMVVSGGLIVLLRYYWGFDASARDSTQQAVAMRYMILIPLYILMTGYVFREVKLRKYAAAIIMINAGVNAVVGILYTLGLLTYKVVSTESDLYASYLLGETTRSSGLYAGVNVFANTLGLALLIAAFFGKVSPLVRSVFISLLVLGILVSQSRWPLLTVAIVLAVMVVRQGHSFTKRLLQVFFLIFVLALAGALTSEQTREGLFGVRSRVAVDTSADIQIRLNKYMVGVKAIFEESRTAFIGARPESLSSGSALEDIFSDNGLLSLVIRSGIPVTLIFLLGCYFALKRFEVESSKSAKRLFWVIVGGTLLLNNAIYWDSWLFHAALVYRLLPNLVGNLGVANEPKDPKVAPSRKLVLSSSYAGSRGSS
jgi:hypothetical protein